MFRNLTIVFFVNVLLLISCQSNETASTTQNNSTQQSNLKQDNPFPNVRGANLAFLTECNDEDPFVRKKCTLEKLENYIRKNIKYPEKAKTEQRKGSVQVRLVIDDKGQIINMGLLKSMGQKNKDMDEEALRVSNLIKNENFNWSPAKYEGKEITNSFVLPFFKFPFPEKLTPEKREALRKLKEASAKIEAAKKN